MEANALTGALQDQYSIVVFPFLRTSGRVQIGDLLFRSTDDVADLSAAQVTAVTEVAEMLFAWDDLHISRATYALVPLIDLTWGMPEAPSLTNTQAVLGYLYASPSDAPDSRPFLPTEAASAVVFTPGDVPPSLTRESPNATSLSGRSVPEGDGFRGVPGYSASYNFRHDFWVERGSRVYPPIPRISLNDHQDLRQDVGTLSDRSDSVALLFGLLADPERPAAARALTALRWYNEANRQGSTDDAALVALAIAFESLFGLPSNAKKDRLVDSIALLLGRAPRLDDWADQFYEARSSVVHEGRSRTFRFLAKDPQHGKGSLEYQPLWTYGVTVFRLCLRTLLVGADLADQARIAERLVTNGERLVQLCRLLDDTKTTPETKVHGLAELVEALDRNRFSSESGLTLKPLVGALRRAVDLLVDGMQSASDPTRSRFASLSAQLKSKDEFEQLTAVYTLASATVFPAELPGSAVRRLADVVWHYTFERYFWLARRASEASHGAKQLCGGSGIDDTPAADAP